MAIKRSWLYHFGFLAIELVQALIGLTTLCRYRPNLTYKFALWHSRRHYRRASGY